MGSGVWVRGMVWGWKGGEVGVGGRSGCRPCFFRRVSHAARSLEVACEAVAMGLAGEKYRWKMGSGSRSPFGPFGRILAVLGLGPSGHGQGIKKKDGEGSI